MKLHYKNKRLAIISYNCAELTLQCIQSALEACNLIEEDILVVDNASSDGSVDIIRKGYPYVEIITNERNLGYAAAVNVAFQNSGNGNLIISNSDVIFHPGSIPLLLGLLDQYPDVGVAGPQQVYPDGSWEYSYGDVPGIKVAIKDILLISSFQRFLRKTLWKKCVIDKRTKIVPYIDGAVMAVNRRAFKDIAGFDEDYFFYTEEADFCFRLKQSNWRVVFNPNVRITHIRGGSASKFGLDEKNSKLFVESKILFVKKHSSRSKLKLFIILEYLHSMIMLMLWSVIKILCPKNISVTNKIMAFRHIKALWKNNVYSNRQ